MKIVPFRIPGNNLEGFRVQVDDLPHLYNHLHQHPEIQITVILESHGTLIAGDYVGPFRQGDVFVIGSNQPHVFRNDESYFNGGSRALAITVFFDESGLGEKFWQLEDLKSIRQCLKSSNGGYRITGQKKKYLGEKLLAIKDASGIDRLILFIEILRVFGGRKGISPLSSPEIRRWTKSYDSERLNKVLTFTFSEYHRSITLREVASMANLTPEAFCKYFKTRTRKTYINFLNEIRINHACRMLSEDRTVASIGYDCGFTNLSNFNRIFKKVKKLTPVQWRKLHGE